MVDLFSTAQAAELLHISSFSLNRWRSRGVGPPFVKLGRKVYYRQADLEKWLDMQLVTPGEGICRTTCTSEAMSGTQGSGSMGESIGGPLAQEFALRLKLPH